MKDEAAAPAVVEAVQPAQEAAAAPVAEKVEEKNGEAAAEPAKDVQPEQTEEQKTEAQTGGEKKSGSKFDPSVQPVTDDPKKIRAQVEFYFSDSNLPSDKFLWGATGGTENKPVSLKTICSFKRMRQFQPYTAVVAALRESQKLVIEGEEGEETVRRTKAYVSSSDAQKKRALCSVYAKGFGEETKTTQLDIEAFFRQYGTVNHCKLRRDNDNKFKGSVFVEFDSEAEADAFLALDPTPEFHGTQLKVMKKIAYIQEKNELIKEGKLDPSNGRQVFYEGKIKDGRGGRGRGGRGRGDRDRGDRERRDDGQRNGFKGGRGGRGRGRGGRGRGGHRDRDGGRDGGRDGDKKEEAAAPKKNDDGRPPVIQSTNENGTPVEKTNGESNGKRAREDDAGDSAPPAKKVDTKVEGQ